MDRHQIIEFGKRLKDEVSEDDVSGASAELAYRFFLALFPFFIFLAALGGMVASIANVQDPTAEIMDMIGESLPDDTSAVLESQLEGVISEQNFGLLSIGILGAVWAASSGVGAMMKNMNRMYGVGESRAAPKRMAIALGLTMLAGGVLVIAFALLFIGQLYGPQIAAEFGLESVAATAFGLARWPIAIVLVLFAVAFLYWLAPNADAKMKWITPGAVFFTIAWLVATFGFGLYVANFGSYNETYGTLGGVVILLIWFYLTSFLLLLGVEINSVLAEKAGDSAVEETEAASGATQEHGRAAARQLQGTSRAGAPRQAPVPRAAGVGLVGIVWLLALIGVLSRREAPES